MTGRSEQPAAFVTSDGGGRGLVEVRGVSKRFGDVVALDAVDIVVPAGAFFSLLGPSGCGKTTLLRILAGLERPDDGRVLADGRDITTATPDRRPFNIVFQRYALFPHMSVLDNVAFGLTTRRSQHASRSAARRRASEMLGLVGLQGLEERLPAQLSGGQAQRVAVARALVREPELLLLDEPLSALDRNVRHALREELLRIHRELGTTFVLVTHDQDEALSMSQYVALMNHGRIEQIAEPEVLYRNPATLFAARFIGAGTFLPGVIRGRNASSVAVEVAGTRFDAYDAGIGDAREAEVLLRPEELAVVDPAQGHVRGPVETAAYFGSYYEVTVSTDAGRFRCRSSTPVAPGTNVGIAWPASAGIAYAAADRAN